MRKSKSYSENNANASSSMASSVSYSGRKKNSGDDSRSTHFSRGSVLCDASIGDSDIQRCNHRIWEDYQHNETTDFCKKQSGGGVVKIMAHTLNW